LVKCSWHETKSRGDNLRKTAPILFLVWAACFAQANPQFTASELAGKGSQWFTCDLDGDGLKDLVLIDGLTLSFFYQDPARAFTREPQQTYHLEQRCCIVWPAKLDRQNASLLVMASDGVSELYFTNRTSAPLVRRIIAQPTIIPESVDETNVVYLSLSVETGPTIVSPSPPGTAPASSSGPPLLLVPTPDGLQVWSAHTAATKGRQAPGEWRQAQVIERAVDSRVRPSVIDPGYSRALDLNLTVGDINGDGRDDLILRRTLLGETNLYTSYLQQTNGLFNLEPALVFVDKAEPRSWLCWVDLNHDGKADLIKSTWLHEPSFVPGHPSGKVLVRAYLADARGRISLEPNQILRKNDWTPALPVVDIDGDGFLDLALGSSPLDTREGVRKEITARQLDYSLRFYFYRPGDGFPKEADSQRDVVIHLDQATLLLGWDRRQYFEHYVKLGGDFNGDGKTDLVVRDRGNDISVYFFISREKGFSPDPDLRFICPEPFEEWEAEDLNHDGISDLIVKMAKQDSFRIFISHK